MSAKGRIFIVDDNPYSAGPLTELLRKGGYEVEATARGTEALEAIPEFRPDLILADVVLSDIDGFTLCERLEHDEASRDVPVVFMGALDQIESKVRGFEHGAIDYITKPFDEREVLARLERHVTVSRVRAALRESEAKFRSVMESAIDAIISADADGNIRSWNEAATALFGYTSEDAIGQPLEIIIPERFREPHRQGLRRVASGGQSRVIGSTVELAAVRRDGTEFPIELSLATWTLDDHRYFTGIIRDISERKEAEQKFRSVTESAIDAIISADREGRIVSWNSAATEILGYSPEEAIGQPIEIIIPEMFRKAHRDGLRRVAGGGESRVIGRTVELQALTKSGEEIPIELSLSTWIVNQERFFTGIIRDITERKRAENQLKSYADELARQHEELALAQGQLLESEKLAVVGRLAAGLMHEVNSPLGAMRSAVDTVTRILESQQAYLEAGCEDEAARQRSLQGLEMAREMSGVLRESTLRITEVMDELGRFVSLDGAERTLHDLRAGLDGALDLLTLQLDERITVDRNLGNHPALVRCDAARLNQAFLNVLQNAIDGIGGEGRIGVDVSVEAERVTVTVTDSGRGMTREQLENVFDFGFTSKNGRVRMKIGLATAKRAVEEAGGTISLDSTAGQGTRVSITLPAANLEDSVVPTTKALESRST